MVPPEIRVRLSLPKILHSRNYTQISKKKTTWDKRRRRFKILNQIWGRSQNCKLINNGIEYSRGWRWNKRLRTLSTGYPFSKTVIANTTHSVVFAEYNECQIILSTKVRPRKLRSNSHFTPHDLPSGFQLLAFDSRKNRRYLLTHSIGDNTVPRGESCGNLPLVPMWVMRTDFVFFGTFFMLAMWGVIYRKHSWEIKRNSCLAGMCEVLFTQKR